MKINDNKINQILLISIENSKKLNNIFSKRVDMYLDYKYEKYAKVNSDIWFPVQKGIANSMGNIRLQHRDSNLISLEQRQDLVNVLEPGDILLERKNWYLSNSGIPGFWPHAALYVGSLEEADAYFGKQDILENKSFSVYLQEKYPGLYSDYLSKDIHDYNHRVLEAIANGVIFQSIEKSANADYLVAFRPRLEKEEKLKAILKAFSFYKLPYDYEFDFATSDAMVCSELVYKAYLPDVNKEGLKYETSMNMGREVLTPVDIAKDFDLTYNTSDQQLDFVIFYDGIEEEGIAVKRGVEVFRTTWMRDKWSFMQQ
jgi:hypothetical protein